MSADLVEVVEAGEAPKARPKRGPDKAPRKKRGSKGAVPPVSNAQLDAGPANEPATAAELAAAQLGVVAFQIAMGALLGPRAAASLEAQRGALGTAIIEVARFHDVTPPEWMRVYGSLGAILGKATLESGALDPVVAAVAQFIQRMTAVVDHRMQDAADRAAGAPPTVDTVPAEPTQPAM